MIMGLSFSHEMWFRVEPAVAREHRVILFDNRGVGRSTVPNGPYTIRQMARDAIAVMDAAGVSAAQVVGASMGGMIAQELALQYPARVRSLVLGCTSHGGIFARWPQWRKPSGFQWSGKAIGAREARTASMVPLLYADATPRERIEEDIRVQCACGWCYKGFFGQFAGILMWSSYFRLRRIQAPTLVVHGAEDRLIPPTNGRVVASRIPNAEFHLVPGAGHMLTTDQPEICTDLLLPFLRRHDTSLTVAPAA
jgi:pimeloyl-ACP methyl ester carboxylesterase